MDIFDEMGKRLGNVGQRTKDAAESARLNSLVSEQEKKIKTIARMPGNRPVCRQPPFWGRPPVFLSFLSLHIPFAFPASSLRVPFAFPARSQRYAFFSFCPVTTI